MTKIIKLKSSPKVEGFSPVGELGRQKPPTWEDPKTGLEWQCESPGEMTWYEAQEYAESLSLDGKRNWRLPTLAELESLLDRTKGRPDGRPLMRKEVPFRDNLSYWSSTTFERHTKNAWIVMFDGAYVLSYYKSNLYRVRCVRG
jgi:formylglycine-generating enzyme required for sulfatase activity